MQKIISRKNPTCVDITATLCSIDFFYHLVQEIKFQPSVRARFSIIEQPKHNRLKPQIPNDEFIFPHRQLYTMKVIGKN